MTLATLQHLRSFNFGEHPVDLEPGQIGLNMSPENFNENQNDCNIYLYVGNGSNRRLDEGGTVLVDGGVPGKGWVRYRLRNLSPEGDTVYGNFDVSGSILKVEANGAEKAELVVPKTSDTPASGTSVGSVRWNTAISIFQAWNGNKWDTTSKVTISSTAPANPSNGDLWFSTVPPNLYVYVVPTVGPAAWVLASSGAGATALQPGNGVTANGLNQIDIIDQGPF